MKDSLLCLIIICLAFQFTYGQEEKKISLKEMNIYGKVRTITEKCYESKLKKADFKKGDLISTTVYNFDEKGNKIEETRDGVNWSKQATNTKVIYKYDNDGHLIEQNTSENGNLTGKITYSYNEKGIKTGYTEFYPDGSISGKQDFKIDDNGNKTEVFWYGRGGTGLSNKLYYKYDNKGNRVECITSNKDGSIDTREYFQYDETGKLVEEKSYRDLKQIKRTTYKYDSSGNEIEWVGYYENGVAFSKGIYRNDYDKNLNWTQRMSFLDGQPLYIFERKISYIE